MSDKKAPADNQKTHAYPFEVILVGKDNPTPRKAQIMKMTDFGYIQQTDASYMYKVHENYDATFVLPGSTKSIQSVVKVVKTYDAMEARINLEKIKVYLVEMHFINLGKEQKRIIVDFCNMYKEKR